MPWAQEDSAARERILAAARREAMRRAYLTDSILYRANPRTGGFLV